MGELLRNAHHATPIWQICNDNFPIAVIANAVKQSIKTQMKYKTQNLNADSMKPK